MAKAKAKAKCHPSRSQSFPLLVVCPCRWPQLRHDPAVAYRRNGVPASEAQARCDDGRSLQERQSPTANGCQGPLGERFEEENKGEEEGASPEAVDECILFAAWLRKLLRRCVL